ncbi:MAG: hypothetical protein ABL890_01155 [Candidatus Peribacteraceae bacterium]
MIPHTFSIFGTSDREKRLLWGGPDGMDPKLAATSTPEGEQPLPGIPSAPDKKKVEQVTTGLTQDAKNESNQTETAVNGVIRGVPTTVANDPGVQAASQRLQSVLISEPAGPAPTNPNETKSAQETKPEDTTRQQPSPPANPEQTKKDPEKKDEKTDEDEKEEDGTEKKDDEKKDEKSDEDKEGEPEEPEAPEEPPKTIGERIDRDIKKAQDIFQNPDKGAVEKIGAAISMIMLIIKKIQAQIDGTIDNAVPVEEDKTKTEAPADQPATPASPTGAETPAGAMPENTILKETVRQHPEGIRGVIREKQNALLLAMKQEPNTDLQDSVSTHGTLSQEKKTLQAKITSTKEDMRDAGDTLARKPGADEVQKATNTTKKLQMRLDNYEADMEAINKKIQINKNRQESLVQEKGSDDAKKLQTEIATLQIMDESSAKNVADMKENLRDAAHAISRNMGKDNEKLKLVSLMMTVDRDPQTLLPRVKITPAVAKELESMAHVKGTELQLGVTEDSMYVKDLDVLQKIFDLLKGEVTAEQPVSTTSTDPESAPSAGQKAPEDKADEATKAPEPLADNSPERQATIRESVSKVLQSGTFKKAIEKINNYNTFPANTTEEQKQQIRNSIKGALLNRIAFSIRVDSRDPEKNAGVILEEIEKSTITNPDDRDIQFQFKYNQRVDGTQIERADRSERNKKFAQIGENFNEENLLKLVNE